MALEAPIGVADLHKTPVPPRYRVLILDRDGHVLRMEQIRVETDDEAMDRAGMLIGGHAVELWDGVRFMAHFPQESENS